MAHNPRTQRSLAERPILYLRRRWVCSDRMLRHVSVGLTKGANLVLEKGLLGLVVVARRCASDLCRRQV